MAFALNLVSWMAGACIQKLKRGPRPASSSSPVGVISLVVVAMTSSTGDEHVHVRSLSSGSTTQQICDAQPMWCESIVQFRITREKENKEDPTETIRRASLQSQRQLAAWAHAFSLGGVTVYLDSSHGQFRRNADEKQID